MIRMKPLGQLGNQMFQYIIGKILADRTGQAYEPGPWLNKAGEPLAWNIDPLFDPKPTPGQRDGIGPFVIDCQHYFDIGNVLPGWEIDATGFFQRYELLAPYRDRIRDDWLRMDRFVETDDEAVYIHVRRTDYLGDDLTPERNCQATTMEEYERCMEEFPDAKRLVIVTDDYKDPFILELIKFAHEFDMSAHCAFGTWDSDFLTLASCRNLIMSQSTFSWWAAFLGQAKKIVCPVFPETYWGNGVGLIGPPKDGRDFPNLEVTDDPGKDWIWLNS